MKLARPWFLAGPMSGYEGWNHEVFNTIARDLRINDIPIANPAENFSGRKDLPWEDYIRASVEQVAQAWGVITLPGWKRSKGARLEVHVARTLGMPVVPVRAFLERIPESKYVGKGHEDD